MNGRGRRSRKTKYYPQRDHPNQQAKMNFSVQGVEFELGVDQALFFMVSFKWSDNLIVKATRVSVGFGAAAVA